MSENIVAGRKVVFELLEGDPARVEMVWVQKGGGGSLTRLPELCRTAGVRYRMAEKAELDRLYSGPHQGAAARLAETAPVSLDEVAAAAAEAPLPLIAVLDQVQDPRNVGALARTLYALGAGGIVIPKHGSASLGPGAVKASAGALSHLPVARVVNLSRALDELIARGFYAYCAQAGEGSESIYGLDADLPAVVVLGNEDKGVRPGVAKRCGSFVHIPFARDFDSLNVAQAGAIVAAFFAASKLQRM